MSAHDVMPDINLFQLIELEDAVKLATRLGDQARLIGGGQDTFDWLKDRNKTTKAMIDLTGIEQLKGIREITDGLEIGAITTLTEIATNPIIQKKYSLLSDAAARVASPQIRNVGTIAGNIAQDARCWYYRRGLDCYRAGGNTCYADTPEGMNREHSILDASRCVAVSPSDTAPALVALNATIVIVDAKGEHELKAADFFVGPDVNITSMTILKPGQIVKSIKIPASSADATFYFEKVADRNVWDFALVNIAAALRIENGKYSAAKIVCGGVACKPYRLTRVEDYCLGKPANEDTAKGAAALAAQGARPLNHNQFKVSLLENLVTRALRV